MPRLQRAPPAPNVQVEQHRLERRETEQQVGAPDVARPDPAEHHAVVRRLRDRRTDPPQRTRDAVGGDAACPTGLTVLLIGQVAVSAQQLVRVADRLIEGQVLQPVNRVVVHEALHRPELGDRFARLPNQMVHALVFAGSRRCRRLREGFSCHAAYVLPDPVALPPAWAGRIASRADAGWSDELRCCSRPVMTSCEPAS